MPRLRDEVFLAAMAEAKSRRMRTTVHVGTDKDVRLAIDAGANGIEHTARGLTDETIAMMAAKKITFTPTLVVLDWAWKRDALHGADAGCAPAGDAADHAVVARSEIAAGADAGRRRDDAHDGWRFRGIAAANRESDPRRRAGPRRFGRG